MKETYLKKVVIYLKQEMPEPYRDAISIHNDKIIIAVTVETSFAPVYGLLHQAITDCISRVRNREFDLDFTIRAPAQERDFKIYK